MNSDLTLVGLVGLFLSLLAIGLAGRRLTAASLLLLILALVMHIGAMDFYYEYTKSASADAAVYYFDPSGWANAPWALGSVFVVKICSLLKIYFDASYIDCFLLFQATGFAGMVLMFRTFTEIQEKVGIGSPSNYALLLFLPSIHFWTSAIGKDAPMFFAISLCVWSALNLGRRVIYFSLSLGLMMLFRPQIALLAAAGLAVAALFEQSVSVGKKGGLLAFAIVVMFLIAGPVQSTIGLDVSSVSNVTDFVDQQNETFSKIAGGTAMPNSPFIIKAISLLFRPFFFDAHDLLGLIASVENIGVVGCFLYVLAHRGEFMHLVKRVFFIRFSLAFALLFLLSLTLLYYNVGLGLRQRLMAAPMLFSVMVALWSMRKKEKAAAEPRFAAGPMTNLTADRALAATAYGGNEGPR